MPKGVYDRKPRYDFDPEADHSEMEEQQQSGPVTEIVTYLPGEGDPPSVKWAGKTLHANVPMEITGHPEGTVAQKANHVLIESARKNKFFRVGSFNPGKDGVPVPEQAKGPQTSDQYKAHAIEWIKRATSVDELDTKWASEESLRIACGVGTDDLDYLGTIWQPKRDELRKFAVAGQ